jgi:hypothetical protein
LEYSASREERFVHRVDGGRCLYRGDEACVVVHARRPNAQRDEPQRYESPRRTEQKPHSFAPHNAEPFAICFFRRWFCIEVSSWLHALYRRLCALDGP